MENYTVILLLLGAMVILSSLSEKIKVAVPVVLTLAGIGLGFIPQLPTIKISPEIVFLLFLPPLLYDAAFKINFGQFRENIYIISRLAFMLVFVTTAGIAAVSHYLIPGMSWPLSFVLGAILAPTDAVAAMSITRGIGLSSSTNTILEGESLLNDASALVALKFALAALAGSAFVLWKASLSFVLLLGGGFITGFVISWIVGFLMRWIRHNGTAVLSIMLLSPFATYLVAEEMHASGVVAVVTLGINLSRLSAAKFPEHLKLQSESIWDMITFLLNGLIFILIGIELPVVVRELDQTQLWNYTGYGALIALTALVLRTISVFGNRNKLHKAYDRQKYQSTRRRVTEAMLLGFQESMVISWSGMRGIISLAIAIGLPDTLETGAAFPMKSVLIYITTVVVLITIVGQGLLLPLIAKPRREHQVPEETTL